MTRKGLIAVVVGAVTSFGTQRAARASEEYAAPKKHSVVLEVSVMGDEVWQGILNNVENLLEAFGQDNVQLELVAHGSGIGILQKTVLPAIQKRLEAVSKRGVVLAACENTMRRKNLHKDDLLPFVTTVPSGVAEVVLRQEAGYAYLKGGS